MSFKINCLRININYRRYMINSLKNAVQAVGLAKNFTQ